ncbi:MAG: lipoprotein [Cohaesibacter sp.]|jgi:predicted small lipoprotein YifL|nr:lipoprotein [Cohaesibacter sp.]
MALRSASSKGLGLAALIGLALVLSACGQKGPLEAPSSQTNTLTDPVDPTIRQSATEQDKDVDVEQKTPTKAPDKRFILDGLL